MFYYIKKIRDVKSPDKAYEEASHWDFYIPNDWKLLPGISAKPEYLMPEWDSKVIYPGQSLFVPSGLQIKLEPGWAIRFDNKSGKGKKGLLVGAQIVDRDYQGEIHLNVWNVSLESITIKLGESILQAEFYQPSKLKQHEVSSHEELFTESSARGSKGFGSTDKVNQQLRPWGH
jgi:dUTPase